MVYAYIFAPLESRLADGSAANHTGVLTPSPFFLNVSRFKYFCPANPTKLIASLLLTSQFTTLIRCEVFYMRYDKKGRPRVKPERPVHHFGGNIYFVRTYVTSSVKASFCSFRNVQVVLK